MANTAGTHITIDDLPEDPGPGYIWGRGLRMVLVRELMRHPEATVAELAEWLADQGYTIRGRLSKVISDALRWEIRRGRVTRLGRGRYRYHRAPATTARRIRTFAKHCRTYIVAVTRREQPPPALPDPRATLMSPDHDPANPPWANLGWLWVT